MASASTRYFQTLFEFGGKVDSSLKNALSTIDDSLKQSQKKFESFQRVADKFTSIGNKLSIGVTTPIVAAGVAATKSAMDFEAGTAKVNTMLKLQGEELQKVKDEALAFSNEYKISNDIVTEAMYQGLSAGIKQEDLMSTLGVAAKAAKGGFTDLATAIDGITNVLNSYGLAAENSNDIANQMLVAQNLGKTTFGELATSVSKVSPIFNQLDLGTNELFSSLAVLTANGIATSESVSGLKAALSNIIKPTTEAASAAEALGISFDAKTLSEKGLIGFASYIQDAIRNAAPEYDELASKYENTLVEMARLEKINTKESKEKYKELSKDVKKYEAQLDTLATATDSPIAGFANLFGSVEGLNAMLILGSQQGTELFNRSMEEMATNTTALDDAFNIMSDTTENTLEGTLIKLQNTAVKLGEKALPIVNKALDGVNNLLDKFNNLSPQTQDMIVKMAVGAALAGPALTLVGKSIQGFGKMKSGIAVIKALSNNFGGIGKIGQSVSKAAKSMGGASKAMGVMTKAGNKLQSVLLSFGSMGALPLTVALGALTTTMAVADHITNQNVKSLDLLGDTLGDDADKVRDFSTKVDTLKTKLGALDATDVNLSAEAKATFLGEVELIVADVQNQIDKQLQEDLKKVETMNASEKEKQRLIQNAEAQKAEIQSIQDGIKALLDKGETQGVDSEQFNRLINALEKSYMQASGIDPDKIASYQTAKAAGENVRAEDLQKVVQEINQIAATEKETATQRLQEIKDTARLQVEIGRITQEEMANQIIAAEENLRANIEGIEQARGEALVGMFEEFGGLMDYINIETGEMKSGFIQMLHSLNLAQNTQKNDLYTQYADLNQITDENMIRYVESNRKFSEMTTSSNEQLNLTGNEINLLGLNAQTTTTSINQLGGAVSNASSQITSAANALNAISIKQPTVTSSGGVTNLPKFAKGGIANSPSIFGEAGPEMAIPLQPNNPRSHMLLEKTAGMLGYNNGGGINLSYNVTINGGTDPNAIKAILAQDKNNVEKMLEEAENKRRRLSFA